jgi:hypothetical protein
MNELYDEFEAIDNTTDSEGTEADEASALFDEYERTFSENQTENEIEAATEKCKKKIEERDELSAGAKKILLKAEEAILSGELSTLRELVADTTSLKDAFLKSDDRATDLTGTAIRRLASYLERDLGLEINASANGMKLKSNNYTIYISKSGIYYDRTGPWLRRSAPQPVDQQEAQAELTKIALQKVKAGKVR